MAKKIKIATTSLAGCFGCHMSLLDIDEEILALAEIATFDRSPLTDVKTCHLNDIGLIEGGVCNEENKEVLQQFRSQCKILVAVGACAINGGLPALRNQFTIQQCLQESYQEGMEIHNPGIPDDPELPALLDKVYPLHELVTIDYYLPGCPPPAESFLSFLKALYAGQEPVLASNLIHYD